MAKLPVGERTVIRNRKHLAMLIMHVCELRVEEWKSGSGEAQSSNFAIELNDLVEADFTFLDLEESED